MKVNIKELEKWTKEELIDFALLRNDDAKDYSKEIIRLKKESEVGE